MTLNITLKIIKNLLKKDFLICCFKEDRNLRQTIFKNALELIWKWVKTITFKISRS